MLTRNIPYIISQISSHSTEFKGEREREKPYHLPRRDKVLPQRAQNLIRDIESRDRAVRDYTDFGS